MKNNTNVKTHKVREPLFQVVKRDGLPWQKSWAIRAVAILISLIVGSVVVVLLTKKNPIDVYVTMLEGTFKNTKSMWRTFHDVAKLLCVSLAVTPAFKMKFWNIGAEGQALVGGLAAYVCMKYLAPGVSAWVSVPVMFVFCIVCGAIWALIPAYFKARFNTNETLFTLMMNYVAMQLVRICIAIWVPNASATLPALYTGNLPILFGVDQLFNILVVVVLTIAMYIYLNYSKQGYEIAVVGESENTARYIGINVKNVILRTMLISGALCGVAGCLMVAGGAYMVSPDTIGGLGFTAIMVSWLAKFNPVYMTFTSFLLVFLDRGAGKVAEVCRINTSV